MAPRTEPVDEASEQPAAPPTARRLPLHCLLWGITGVVAIVGTAIGASQPWPRLGLAALLSAAALILQIAPVRIGHDGQSEYLHLDEAFLVPMTIYLAPPEVAAGIGVAALAGNLWHRRGWMRTAFNTGQTAAAAAVGAIVAESLGAGTGTFTGRTALAAVAGVLVYSVLSMLAVAAIINLAQRTPISATLRDGFGVRVATWGSALSLGVLITAAIELHAWVLVTAVVPIAMLQFAYRRAFRQYRERRQIERLYEASTAIRATVDSGAVRRELVRTAYELLPAKTAELTAPTVPAEAGGLRVSLDEATDIEVTPADGSSFDDQDRFMLQALTSVAATALANARFQERLAYQAFHDPVTDLPNRALFLDRLHHAQARMARVTAHYALVFIDLDRFKVVNDSLGHAAGDDLLVQVAGRLQGALRAGDTLARFGGDEFVALLEDLESEGEASLIVERLLASLEEPFCLGERELIVTASAGVVIGDGTHLGPEECVREGDVAMYRAKARGGGCFEVFRHDLEGGGLPRLDLEIDLRRALSEGELELHYQPVVRTRGQAVVGVEALVRWRHPVRGLVPPAEFIPLAEETGLILPLGRYVLEEACRQVGDWRRAHPEFNGLVVSVNLSPRQFRQVDLDRQVAEALERSGLDPASLSLEVTEGVMVEDVESATSTLNRLKALGVSISVDDFGTGYSSLSYLKRFPIDYVKIDRSFIAGLDEKVDSEIVRSVIRLAAAIGIDVVAEGVENAEQLARLEALGCPLVQGYHVARPQPPSDAEAFIVESLRPLVSSP
ncbi:MAG TPA: bifunctional diguanylate cyclase/phosphodiesterase [Acidimicrobiia bacterium]|nr:bifunctional diguanylate cyclase/phosphodiesterase [Acidimicrobiia bacterium]